MHLQIKPGLCQLWRGPATVQIGLDARRGTVLDGLTGSDRELVKRLSEGLDSRQALTGPPSQRSARTRRLLDLLAEARVLVRSRTGRAALTRLGPARDRLADDAQIWSIAHGAAGDGWELLAARAARTVEIAGAGRTGTALAATLASAGVGTVRISDPHPVRPADVAPAGPLACDIGIPRQEAARQAIARIGCPAAAGDDTTEPRPDLVVLVEHPVADAFGADRLLAADVPHLSVVLAEAGILVGPLVVPGHGPCLRCLDLHRGDRDPAWPRLLAQLLAGRRERAREETASAGLAASLAALQVLAYLDGISVPSSIGATLEIDLPDGLVSRRPWPAHPRCGCHWPPAATPGGPNGAAAGRIPGRAGTMPS